MIGEPTRVLFACACGRYPVLAYEGEEAGCHFNELGFDMGEAEDGLPVDEGFYVWEGELSWISSSSLDEPAEPELVWDGHWRLADVADFVDIFDFPVPQGVETHCMPGLTWHDLRIPWEDHGRDTSDPRPPRLGRTDADAASGAGYAER